MMLLVIILLVTIYLAAIGNPGGALALFGLALFSLVIGLADQSARRE